MKLTPRALAAAAATTAALLAPAAPAAAWAPPDDATVRPGVQTITGGSNQCTANFVFADGATVYIGQAAHCSGTGAANETNGCRAGSMPNGTRVEIEDHRDPGAFPVRGTMVYNSWLAMQADGEADQNACRYNDFALVRLDDVTAADVNPTIPFWGGPEGVTASVPQLDDVFSYGNSSLRFGVEPLKPKRGTNVQQTGGGWHYDVYTATAGIPGDSGSAFVDASGRAFGVLSTLAIAPLPASNGVSDVSRAIQYMHAHTDAFDGVTLQSGTEPFDASRVL
ncbi:MAG TPA: serine protease [Solirubrobacteraceae bacterium]|nr:serine protease [Solirubrobacteraceae bacterium]